MSKKAVILIGHGGVPADFPKDQLGELKRLEAKRQESGSMQMSAREAELDTKIRNWPRTKITDPYKWGLEDIINAFRNELGGNRLEIAYNEFCAPSLDDSIEKLVKEGFDSISIVTTMYTRGGYHSEVEIPQLVELARKRHSGIIINYAWPFGSDLIARFLNEQLKTFHCGK